MKENTFQLNDQKQLQDFLMNLVVLQVQIKTVNLHGTKNTKVKI